MGLFSAFLQQYLANVFSLMSMQLHIYFPIDRAALRSKYVFFGSPFAHSYLQFPLCLKQELPFQMTFFSVTILGYHLYH